MKTKLEMAHEWAMKHGKSDTIADRTNMIIYAWDYADAMQAEEDKRSVEEVLKKHKAIRKVSNEVDTFCRKAEQRFEDAKRFIESYKLVESYGGLEKAKIRCYPAKHVTMESYHKLKQAIKDVESCL